MSTITLASTTSNGSTPVTGAPRHRLLRLWLVELRKLVDTPAGVALLAVGALLAGVFGGGVALLSEDATLDRIVRLAGTPTGLLLPVLAVLLVTGERQHRTALTGYALTPGGDGCWSPRRSRCSPSLWLPGRWPCWRVCSSPP